MSNRVEKLDGSAREVEIKKHSTMLDVKNLSADTSLDEVKAVGSRVLVALRAWPKQTVEGIETDGGYTIHRKEQQIAVVLHAGEDVDLVEEGDVVIMSMYSGYHVTTKTGHAKIINNSDILNFKKKDMLQENDRFAPEDLNPGINYITVKINAKKEIRTESGITIESGDDTAEFMDDAVTRTAVVIAVGPVNEFGKKYKQVKKGSKIIIDAYVGVPLNNPDVNSGDQYISMLSNDILGYLEK